MIIYLSQMGNSSFVINSRFGICVNGCQCNRTT